MKTIQIKEELCDWLIEPIDMGNYETFDVDKGREIFDLGYNTASQFLDHKLMAKSKLLVAE